MTAAEAIEVAERAVALAVERARIEREQVELGVPALVPAEPGPGATCDWCGDPFPRGVHAWFVPHRGTYHAPCAVRATVAA